MIWHWRVSTGMLEPANQKPDRAVVYLSKGDKLSLRDVGKSETTLNRSGRTGFILPISRNNEPARTDACPI